jgi:protein-disulfide isomerase
MSNKDTEGMSKRQAFREKRRRSAQRNRLIGIGLIVVGAVIVALFLIYPQVKPIAAIQPAPAQDRPAVSRNTSGDPNAPVKLTAFSDYQCPFCKEFWSTTEGQIIDAYVKTNKVQFIERSAGNWVSGNIGGTSTESQDAAMAAYCAGDQNKFWEMNDALFTNVIGEDAGSFTQRRLEAIAQNVGLDVNAFNTCLSSNKYLGDVQKDLKDAQAAGIQGTPFFTLSYTAGGQPKTDILDGAQPFSVFQQKLDAALAAAGAK